MNKKKFFILDGSSLLYRAFYALPLLESETGVYTNAIVGFSNMLVKLVQDWQPDYLAIAFDKGKHTFRTDMFADYKGTRKPMPDELRSQVPMLHEMAEAWGIPLLELAEYEADDIIGTLANKAVAEGMSAYVVTGDRDALQLVKEDLTVLFTKKGISELKAYDVPTFEAEYEGLAPIQLIDLKGLMGDTSDNIPGVPKVGPKTAIKLIAAYGSVEQVLLHVEEVSGKALKENLRNNQQLAVLSKQLATIKLDVPIDFAAAEMALVLDVAKLNAFYTKYNIRAVQRQIKKLTEDAGVQVGVVLGAEELPDTGVETHTLLKMAKVKILTQANEGKELLAKVRAAGGFTMLPACVGKVPNVKLTAVAVAVAESADSLPKLYYFATGEDSSEQGMEDLFAEQAEPQANPAWEEFLPAVHDASLTKYVYNLKGMYHVGLVPTGEIWDLELAGYLLNPAVNKYAVAELAERYGVEIEALGQDAPEAEQLGWQVLALSQLAHPMTEKLAKLGMQPLYTEIELPLVRVLADMEATGIYVNKEKLAEQNRQAAEHIAALETEIYELAGMEFNIASPKQLGEVLFDKLQLPVIKKTKTGYSTNVEVLNELYNLHPIIAKVLEYRVWTKLKSTYLDGIRPLIDGHTQRVHTSFNQMVTATGRLSSSEPNLQNIPVRREEGKHIREFFEPSAGYDLLLSADYSQIELRVLADMSQDKSFLQAFQEQEDIHARTAAEVFGLSIDEVTADLRRKAKAVNFGIVYGISDYGLSQDLHITRTEAKEYIQTYFAKCPGVKNFIDGVVADAKQKGYVLTKYGRRRELPGIRSSNFNQRSLSERMAMNTPIQGTAADIIKLAMIRAYSALQDAGLKSRILLQVHDELVLEVVESELPEVQNILKEAMEHAAQLSVPLTIDINTGKNWAEAK